MIFPSITPCLSRYKYHCQILIRHVNSPAINTDSCKSTKNKGGTRVWTGDLSICSRMLYHWAIPPWSLTSDSEKYSLSSYSIYISRAAPHPITTFFLFRPFSSSTGIDKTEPTWAGRRPSVRLFFCPYLRARRLEKNNMLHLSSAKKLPDIESIVLNYLVQRNIKYSYSDKLRLSKRLIRLPDSQLGWRVRLSFF